jgi:DNA-binding transcriptional ArsR family regulator
MYGGVQMVGQEDEIYSTMFTSLKHPVRRKILRMLGQKPMTFTEIVEELEISSPNLTYHLESLGELVYKMENDKYKLSSFGHATINAMKGIEEVREVEPKHRSAGFKWKMFSSVLMVVVLVLASFSTLQYMTINELASAQQSLSAEMERLQAYGAGSDKVLSFFKNVTKLDTKAYTVSLDDNEVVWRPDIGGIAEETMKYSLDDHFNNKLDIDIRFRNNHFSRYDLHMTENTPIFSQTQPSDVLQNAKFTLARYKTYSGDDYLVKMTEILETVSKIENNKEVVEGNLKLQIFTSAGTVLFAWMHTENGIDYQTKGLQMVFQNNILITMTDGYFLYVVGNTNLAISKEQSIEIAKSHVRTLTYNIEGQQVSGFTVADDPLSVQLVPHTRGNSVALIPYWFVELKLNEIYAGGINVVTVGIYADTGKIANVQMLSSL